MALDNSNVVRALLQDQLANNTLVDYGTQTLDSVTSSNVNAATANFGTLKVNGPIESAGDQRAIILRDSTGAIQTKISSEPQPGLPGYYITNIDPYPNGPHTGLVRSLGSFEANGWVLCIRLKTYEAVNFVNVQNLPPPDPAGGLLVVQNGALVYIGSSGTVTTLAPA